MSCKVQLEHPLVNQYSLTLGQDPGQHDTKSLIKCVETLSFIVRDAAHVTPDNFELCVRAIRVFVEASLNGGENLFQFTAPPEFGHQYRMKRAVMGWSLQKHSEATEACACVPEVGQVLYNCSPSAPDCSLGTFPGCGWNIYSQVLLI